MTNRRADIQALKKLMGGVSHLWKTPVNCPQAGVAQDIGSATKWKERIKLQVRISLRDAVNYEHNILV